MRSIIPVVLGVGVLLSALGCAPVETPGPSSTPPVSSPSPSPSPSDVPPEAASIEITSERFSILDDEGTVLGAFTYFDATPDPAIAELTELFGAPTVTQQDAVTHFAAVSILDWSGFQLWDYEYETSFPSSKSFRLVVTTSSVAGISIETSEKVAVGDAAGEVATHSYRDWLDTSSNVHFYLLDQSPVEMPDLYPDYEPAAFSIGVWVEPGTGVVYRIDSPGENWGA